MKSPTSNQQQVSKALLAFYQQPIAQVSTELFFTVVAVLFFAIFAIRPTILTMTDLIKEIDDKKLTSEAMSKKVAALSSVQVEYFALQNQFGLLEEVIPQEPETQKVLKIIEKLANENQINIRNISLKEVPLKNEQLKNLEFHQKQPLVSEITINTSSSYENLRVFIEQLLFVRPMITLNALTFNKDVVGESINQNTLSATLRLEIHYYGKGVSTPEIAPTTTPDLEI